MKVQTATIHCKKCGDNFKAELAVDCAISVFVASIDAIRCECGGEGKDLSLVKTEEGR